MEIVIPKQEEFLDEQVDTKLLQLELAKANAQQLKQDISGYDEAIQRHKTDKAVDFFAKSNNLMAVRCGVKEVVYDTVEYQQVIVSGQLVYAQKLKTKRFQKPVKTSLFEEYDLMGSTANGYRNDDAFKDPIPADITQTVLKWKKRFEDQVSFTVLKPVYEERHLTKKRMMISADPMIVACFSESGYIVATWNEFYNL